MIQSGPKSRERNNELRRECGTQHSTQRVQNAAQNSESAKCRKESCSELGVPKARRVKQKKDSAWCASGESVEDEMSRSDTEHQPNKEYFQRLTNICLKIDLSFNL